MSSILNGVKGTHASSRPSNVDNMNSPTRICFVNKFKSPASGKENVRFPDSPDFENSPDFRTGRDVRLSLSL